MQSSWYLRRPVRSSVACMALRLVLGMVRGPNSHTAKSASHQMGLSLEEEMPKAEAKVILSSWWLKATFQLHYQQHPLLRVGLWVVSTEFSTPLE